uniref:Uncharacterized protein n=1 Tax=Trichuris muris TaxID=70415 RepID=A0A5S6QQN1_TRIMR
MSQRKFPLKHFLPPCPSKEGPAQGARIGFAEAASSVNFAKLLPPIVVFRPTRLAAAAWRAAKDSASRRRASRGPVGRRATGNSGAAQGTSSTERRSRSSYEKQLRFLKSLNVFPAPGVQPEPSPSRSRPGGWMGSYTRPKLPKRASKAPERKLPSSRSCLGVAGPCSRGRCPLASLAAE